MSTMETQIAAPDTGAWTRTGERTRLLLVADRSASSGRATQAAAELARAMDLEVFVVHIHERNPYLEGTGDFATTKEAEAFVSAILNRLETLEVTARGEVLTTRTGRAAEALVNAAASLGASLILMGRGRTSGLMALIARSPVEKVIKRSGTPVLAVP